MIFDKNNDGARELQTLVGVYFRSNDFSVIASEIRSASDEVRRLAGGEVFDRAERRYASDEYEENGTDPDDRLVHAVQLCVARLAMSRFYAQNILSHEDGGRKVKIHAESEKMPWQWQYDRDDEAMTDNYHRALDELFRLLEAEQLPEWQAAPLRRRLAGCFIREIDDFEAVFPIEGSPRMFFLLVPFVKEAQERVVRPIVGDEAYARMAAGEVDDTLAAPYAAARRALPLYAVITAVRRMSIRILPTMIVRRFVASFQGGRGGDMDAEATRDLLQTLTREAEEARRELQKAVTRRNPADEACLVPRNCRRNKFFSA